ncbi:hypothetical protein ECE50_002865 [Chitinophaga sp. Mgbs1]|uniref:Uncharacterized protein n=1 Tax=Chitinophaga solisilvae TaxID=1233460 RepID=A0A9Q5CWR1_9BACT|nr:hypothetical protein [Chitinophaga solisilvae]
MLNILQQNGGSSSFQRLYPWPQGSDRQSAFILPDETAGGIIQVDCRKETEITGSIHETASGLMIPGG